MLKTRGASLHVETQLYVREGWVRLGKIVRRFANVDDWANHRAARNKAVSALRSAKRQFYNSSFEENKHNTRAIWKTINTPTGSKRNTEVSEKLECGWV